MLFYYLQNTLMKHHNFVMTNGIIQFILLSNSAKSVVNYSIVRTLNVLILKDLHLVYPSIYSTFYITCIVLQLAQVKSRNCAIIQSYNINLSG